MKHTAVVFAVMLVIGACNTASAKSDVDNKQHNIKSYSSSDLQCLAKNIFFEAGNQSDKGKKAVGLVTINRASSGKYPRSICNVISQKNQFSWYRDRKSNNPPKKSETWQKSLNIAKNLVNDSKDGHVNDFTHGATHFHATSVRPAWRKRVQLVMQIGQHKFYKS